MKELETCRKPASIQVNRSRRRQLSANKLPNEFENKQTNEIVLTKTSLSVPRTNPFSEALFGVDNVVLFCYVQSRPLHDGGHKRFDGRRDKSRRPLDMRSRQNIRNLTSGSPP